ncbi:MAG TPA: sulfotransferase [Dyella sp.]|uniref:sulfotransferase n=1 Tax=Dyella sp. TaxID=1869338 RepID=UPI002C69B1ED|nr:sulfotransferase [Dyella sp.]HTV86828.1 sulfotransferase [Dyella sp.]
MVTGPAQTPLFIVSTGRSGSTMLSDLLLLHPDVLSLSELFNALHPLGFAEDRIDGAGFWSVLSQPRARHTAWLRLMERGLVIDEFRYPLADALRFRQTGIPPLLAMTLPPLCDDPDALHEELGAFVRALPEDRLQQQYLHVFQWLCTRLGRRVWCERSGASLGLVHPMSRHFPDAKFIHVFRDGREFALSARGFAPMRMGMIGRLFKQRFGSAPYLSPAYRAPVDLPPAWRGLVPESFDVEVFQRLELPLEPIGLAWSEMISVGLQLLRQVPAERVLHVRYESMLQAPREELARIVRFMDPSLDNDAWLAQAAARVRKNPPKWMNLAADERARLEAACAPGMALLDRLA